MARSLVFTALFLAALPAQGQIQVDLKFKRLQYIAFEPVIATVKITNMAGRDILLRDANDQHWHGFEVTATEGRVLAPLKEASEPPLKIAAGSSVTRKINLMPLFPISDLGVYHVRANVFFADLNKFFYAPAKVFEVTNARPIWQRTVGDPSGGGVRTYSLMTNRFPDHTSLYVRVEDKENSLGLFDFFVRPDHLLRRTACRSGSPQSTARPAMLRAPRLVLFGHRPRWALVETQQLFRDAQLSASAARGRRHGSRCRGNA